ncbi:MAG: hypothetical protein ACXW20_17555 [Burkholderiales bacterium]
MSQAARLHDDELDLTVIEPALELAAREPGAAHDPPLLIGDRQFEDVLCHINSNGCSIHVGLLSVVSLTPPNDSAGTMMPQEKSGRSPSHHSSGREEA